MGMRFLEKTRRVAISQVFSYLYPTYYRQCLSIRVDFPELDEEHPDGIYYRIVKTREIEWMEDLDRQ